jgi:hypothetical protein
MKRFRPARPPRSRTALPWALQEQPTSSALPRQWPPCSKSLRTSPTFRDARISSGLARIFPSPALLWPTWLHYPKGYFAFPDTAPAKNEDQLRLMAAVQSSIESSSIPVQATVERVDQPPHWFKVICSIDAHDLSLVQSGDLRKGTMEVYIVEQDQTGKVLLQSGKSFTLQSPENKYDALLKSGLFFHELVEPKSGAITLRVMVEDPATSEVGSLIIPLSQIN